MGLFREKTVEDYIKQIIRLAKKAKEDLPDVLKTGKNKKIIRCGDKLLLRTLPQ